MQGPQAREAAGQPYRSALYDFLRGHSDVLQTLVTVWWWWIRLGIYPELNGRHEGTHRTPPRAVARSPASSRRWSTQRTSRCVG